LVWVSPKTYNMIGPSVSLRARSTLELVGVSNLAYRTSLYFELQRLKEKKKIDGKRRLTIEQSTALRSEMANQEERFRNLWRRKIKICNLGSQVKQFTAEHISFKILIARYGSDEGEWRDETNLLNEDLKANQLLDFVVSNVYFTGKDPAVQIWKELDIVYQSAGEIRTVFAR